MKKLLLSLVLVAGFAAGALAQQSWGFNTISLPAVVAVANSPTNFPTPFVIDVRKQNVLNLYFQVSSADSSSTTNVTFKGAWSPDGSTTKMDTNNAVTLTANMLAGIKCYTDSNTITANGKSYFIIYQESIGANSAITNNDAGYVTKIGAP